MNQQQDLFQQVDPDPPGLELIVSFDVPGRVPSWNEILGMEQWARWKFKDQVQADFLSALQASAAGSSTKTISAKSILLTAADTLACYRAMRQAQRKSKRSKGKPIRGSKRESPSKFSASGKVPF